MGSVGWAGGHAGASEDLYPPRNYAKDYVCIVRGPPKECGTLRGRVWGEEGEDPDLSTSLKDVCDPVKAWSPWSRGRG